jgi:two-component system, cell cycle sensor histidine kinase and response regulator CckA
MTILVVEDDIESRTLLTTILTAEGYEVRAADGGELALESVAVRRPELILLDIGMQGMDGFEICRRLKENVETQAIPIIFLSASREAAKAVRGLRLGAVDYVGKPFQREELLARVRTHLELARLRAQLEQQVEERTAELWESELRFRTMANAAPLMIWTSGVDKLCTFCNKGWLEFTGRTMEQELGTGWTESIHRDDIAPCYEIYSSAFDARRSFQMEYRLRRADGEYRWVLDRGVPRFHSNDVFTGYVGSCIDITDIKRNHERMLATQKLESLGLMAAGVAHDFGNLLGSIYAESDLALSEMPPESPGRENLERIEGLAKHATDIVHLLMDSAGAGVDTDTLEPVDLSSLVEQMLRLLIGSISKGVVVSSDLARDLRPIRGNAAQIGRVVMNLITNASEALEGRPGTITVTTGRVRLRPENAANYLGKPLAGDYIRLKVEDTGRGMGPETRSRIFDQFFTTKPQGKGLGLAAVRGIVQSHGGSIQVASTPGVGTTFEILFPAASQAATA